MCIIRRLFKKKYKIEEVFTPTVPAGVAYISREKIEERLEKALDIPGKQIVIFGHSGSGKTTMLRKTLEKKKLKAITTSCTKTSTLESIILDAFDQLNPYYTDETKKYKIRELSAEASASYKKIKGSLQLTLEKGEEKSEKRALPPQLTVQRLCQFISDVNLIWVIEDFHKVAEEEKTNISQMMKLFIDRIPKGKRSKIIVLGAAEHGYEVCKHDNELNNRVSEIEVPLMTGDEIWRVLESGERALNIELSDCTKSKIVEYSNNLATIAHQLAYNVCDEAGVKETQARQMNIDDKYLEQAVEEFVSEKKDTYNKFYLELTEHKNRKYANVEIILNVLSNLENDAFHRDIYDAILKKYPDYPQSNVSTYLKKLCGPESEEVLRNIGGRYSFSDPFFKSYIRMKNSNSQNGI